MRRVDKQTKGTEEGRNPKAEIRKKAEARSPKETRCIAERCKEGSRGFWSARKKHMFIAQERAGSVGLCFAVKSLRIAERCKEGSRGPRPTDLAPDGIASRQRRLKASSHPAFWGGFRRRYATLEYLTRVVPWAKAPRLPSDHRSAVKKSNFMARECVEGSGGPWSALKFRPLLALQFIYNFD